MKKVVEFDFHDIISYHEYNNIIDELGVWYQYKREDIEHLYQEMLKNKNYEQSTEIMKTHSDIIIELINKVISKLDLKNKEIGIFVSNSFARETNLLNSDIDINFMYEDMHLSVYEELISSIIASVMSKYRDFVHDSISHKMSTEQIEDEDAVTYKYNFIDETIMEDITEGNESLMYKLYNTKKDRESFIKYFVKHINNPELMEWVYYQKVIYDKDDYLGTMMDYIQKLEQLSKSKNLEKYITYLVNEIAQEKQKVENFDFTDIALLKDVFKNHGFKVINDFLTILTKSDRNEFQFETIESKLDRISNLEIKNIIKDYFGRIMALDYICHIYGIGFRTRFSQSIDDNFLKFYAKNTGENLQNLKVHLLNVYESILYSLDLVARKAVFPKFDVETEHINIESYSPLWYVNDVSKEYQKGYFLLPFIDDKGKLVPIHPDTLSDLNIPRSKIVDEKLIYPTSSTRTVYDPNENICYKLPVLRKITRSVRSLSEKELLRSEMAWSYLNKYSYPNFEVLKEECFHNKHEILNYIKRSMPNEIAYPWFYLIVSNKFPKSFMLDAIRNIIDIWMYYASLGIYFESFHTQNILVDESGKIYYRDLSDVRILEEELMRPSYLSELKNRAEFHSIAFDRSVIMQNIEHFLRYRKDINEKDINFIKNEISERIKEYELEFPNYSMNYDTKVKGHHPIPCELVRLRKK